MSDCLTDEQLEKLAAEAGPDAETVCLHPHLASCSACRELLAECRENMSFVQVVKGGIPKSTAGHSIIQAYLDDPHTSHLVDTVAGYELLHELHRGTQGVVYQAIQTTTNRQVAIKFLREGAHASRATRKRFEREIELVAGLRHPNIIRVFESGVSSTGHHYFVMDYVHGLPLNRYVWHKEMSLEQALELFTVVCDAVNFAHQHGVIHRDLKPSNVLIDADGMPHVLDFGLARSIMKNGEKWASMTGEVVGTLPFMSPEQTRGSRHQIDIRTDVYSLGVILYQMLTGQYPYPVTGPIAEVLNHIAETEPVPPRRRWSPVSGGIRQAERAWSRVRSRAARKQSGPCPIDDELEIIVLRALAKDPARRYPNVESLNQDIRRYLQGQPIEAKRDAGLRVLRRSLVRYKAAAVATATGVVLSIVLAGVIYNMYLTQRHLREWGDLGRRRVVEMQGRLANALIEVGNQALDRGDASSARAQYQAALLWNQNIAAGLLDSLPSHARLAETYMRLGDAALHQNDLEEACASYRQFHAMMVQLAQVDDQRRAYRDYLANSKERLSRVLSALGGNPEEARELAEAAIQIRQELAAEPQADPSVLESYARLLLTSPVPELRDARKALPVAQEAVRRSQGKVDPARLGTLALAWQRNGDPAKGRELQAESLRSLSAGDVRLRHMLETLFDESSSLQNGAGGAQPVSASRPGGIQS